MYICVYVYMCVYLYVYTYMCIHTHTYIYLWLCYHIDQTAKHLEVLDTSFKYLL